MTAVRPAIRRATRDDVPRVVEIERSSFSDPWTPGAFRSAADEERLDFLVAEHEGRVVGYSVSWGVVDQAELANLAVAADARGLGIGGQLLDAAMALAREAGCESMHLEVRESNVAARALYGSRGFAEVGRRRRYYRAPVEDALVLRAEIVAG
ncbi:MAG: ribosomal protein S18-alanine N-acetyltransferase [Gemmatimonadaceae bacterium]|nr:ribosomal protein S18-alanine N-acetyltransferase [Gemmatimonadaceae bacterium]NUQ92895.1 ribosomal protein S18-alanine N-acetyltransferase [Gemmatimonadaceae bacterium]NUR18151.1 ribosomal protein S18-alanine N-acetyltransferase [Gemmatimonadaceae bacterium]NUS97167.1 ribosomal protein S18-alanine N-acetyltransferase [Gemmatimonadaceae bacterium]